jgi:PAS domain S-box-containing protein
MNKRLRLTIAAKTALGFGVVILSVLISYTLIYNMLLVNKEKTDELSQEIIPSLSAINSYALVVNQSKNLIKNWVLYDSFDDTPKKRQLKDINQNKYPALKETLNELSKKWEPENRTLLNEITKETDKIFSSHAKIMRDLDSFEKYNDQLLIGRYKSDVEEGNPMMRQTDSVLTKLDKLRSHTRQLVVESSEEMQKSFINLRVRIIISVVILILLIVFIAYITADSLIRRVRYINKKIKRLAEGQLPEEEAETGKDEIGKMAGSINKLIKGLKEKAEFTEEIGKGNFNIYLSASKTDVLGTALTEMRNSLEKASQEAELRRIENQQRTWSSQGIAKFNEIIREYGDDAKKFYVVTISELTKYLDAQIGGLYIVTKDENEADEDARINLEGFYAYGRNKFEQKTIKPGENLVGQCYWEKETIFMTDIPKGYVEISSGLGQDDPKSLLIVPLKLNEQVYGIVEIASLNVFEDYQIDFAEKTGEIIASTISNLKISQKTAVLLEESNEKSERLAKQEEESRRAIQELEKAKEELLKKEKAKDKKFSRIEDEYKNEIRTLEKKLKLNEENLESNEEQLKKYMEVLNSSLMIIETDMNKQILRTNKRFINTVGISYLDISGKSLDKFLEHERTNSKEYIEVWRKLKEGKSAELINEYYFQGKKMVFRDTYTPFRSANNEYYKVMIASVKLEEYDDNKQENTNQKQTD